jgi:hypothetical protein
LGSCLTSRSTPLRCHSAGCGNGGPHAIEDAIRHAKFSSQSHPVVIQVYDEAGNVIETHERKGDFKEW